MNFEWSKYFNAENGEKLLKVLMIIGIGALVIYLITVIVKAILPKSFSKQRKKIINRVVY